MKFKMERFQKEEKLTAGRGGGDDDVSLWKIFCNCLVKKRKKKKKK